MKKKRFLLILIILIPVVVGFFFFLMSRSEYYESPLGFSFRKPNTGNVTEFSFDIKELKDVNVIDPTRIDTTSASVATEINTDSYWITVTKMESVGSVQKELINKMAYGGGDFFQFLNADTSWFDQIQSRINEKLKPTDFSDSGQVKRFGVASYITPNSQLFGITNFRISGFAVPGLGLSKEYYLIDQKNKYIFYVVSDLACSKKEQLEEKYREYNSDGSWRIKDPFNSEEYISLLHTISEECESSSKNKADLDAFLGSIELN